MRIAFLYAPPWRIPDEGEAPDPIEGPPPGYRPGDLDADFYQVPYGLLTLASQAKRAGHQIKVLNLSAMTSSVLEAVARRLDADLYALSCWTANRRGVDLLTRLLKAHHPATPIVVGGPHATPLAEPLLRRFEAVDVVCTGESDETFLELVGRLAAGEDTRGIAGSVYRDERRIVRAPERKNLGDLDTLRSPHEDFSTHIFMTSRGCPWSCTFCAAETSWGRGYRSNSVEYVLHALETCISRLPVRMIQIKDDTFTTKKKRVLELCRGIRERNLRFLWSCDTRVDLLTDELCREMRLAGCERMSLGVETGSQRILDLIQKKITPDEILETTRLARRYGIRVRFYMMLGNRGETVESFEETLAFLARADPDEWVFSCLSIYPGTADFHDAVRAHKITPESYFDERFQELKVPFDADEACTTRMNGWFAENSGLHHGRPRTLAETRETLALLGDHPPAHLDVAAAAYREGDLAVAKHHAERALALGHPCPGLVLNHLACVAHAEGDLDEMMALFLRAAKTDPQHHVLIGNVNRAKAWFAQGGPAKRLPLELSVAHGFALLERTIQPTLPGPLPPDFDVWSEATLAPEAAPSYIKTPDVEGSKKGMTRLRVRS